MNHRSQPTREEQATLSSTARPPLSAKYDYATSKLHRELLLTESQRVRLFFVGGPISLFGGGEAGGNWIRQGVVGSGGGSGGRRYFCRQRPMGDFRWSSRAS